MIIAWILISIGCLVIIFILMMVNPWLASAFCGAMILFLGLLICYEIIKGEDNHNNSI